MITSVRKYLRKGKIVRKHTRVVNKKSLHWVSDNKQPLSMDSFKKQNFPSLWKSEQDQAKQKRIDEAERNRLNKEAEKEKQRQQAESDRQRQREQAELQKEKQRERERLNKIWDDAQDVGKRLQEKLDTQKRKEDYDAAAKAYNESIKEDKEPELTGAAKINRDWKMRQSGYMLSEKPLTRPGQGLTK